jgi:hypothetical protein
VTDLDIDRRAERSPLEPVHPPVEPGWPAASPGDGVRLARLAGLAGLTPAQALEIAAGLLAEVATREPDGGPGEITVGVDGRVRMVPGAAGPAVDTALAAVRAAVRGRRTDPLLAELDGVLAQLPVIGVPAAARVLADACAALDRAAVRAELGALVRAVAAGSAAAGPSHPLTPQAAGPGQAIAGGVAPAGRRPARSRGTSAAVRRVGAWVLSIAVLVGVVLLEIAFLRDDILADVDLLLDAGRSGAAPAAAPPEPDGLPVVLPAPPSAGSVAGVDLRALRPCTPGAPCPVRVLVRLLPAADPQTVTWSYRLVDRCTGATETVAGGSVTVPAQADQAVAVGSVALPPVPAVAVVAVTDGPAVAAAAPVLVGTCVSEDG